MCYYVCIENELGNKLMKISKSIVNFAERRNIFLNTFKEGTKSTLCFYESDNDNEWMFSYTCNEDGTLTWNGNIYLSQSIKEELPATIFNEKQLKAVIDFVSKEIKK